MSYTLSIVSPEGKIFEDIVESIAVPGAGGGFEVYSMHASLISTLKSGPVRIRQKGRTIVYDIPGGVLEVTLEHDVLLLADHATLIP